MYSKRIFIIAFAGILFYSCGRKTAGSNVETISINPHEAAEYVNLSEIADSIKCIKLQSDPDDIMGRVLEIIIKKKYIYAWDASQKIIFVFDKEGKLVSKLDKKGQGPGEYLHISNFFVDDNEEYIEIRSFTNMLKYKNISFEWIASSPFPDVNCNMIIRNANLYYCATQQLDNSINGEKTNAELVIVDDKNNVKTLFDKNIETNHHYFAINGGCFTKNDKNEIFMSLMYGNTFYRLEAGTASPVFAVDFGKYSLNNNTGFESTETQMKYIKEINGLAFFPLLNMNNENVMSFSYYFKSDNNIRWPNETDFRQYIKFKKKNKVYHVKQIKNDLSDFPSHAYIGSDLFGCIHEVWYEDYLVDIVLPDQYISDGREKIFVEGLGEIRADDDPIVVLMKLKK
ncbi:MAG: 6-bladed beta-propeller [Tannerella sp.]|jgi:hypothetical protein|nr:6-bladed beta-propeller [Tannerella sp.]